MAIYKNDNGTWYVMIQMCIRDRNFTEPLNVIYQSAEDGLADTVKPRLEQDVYKRQLYYQ